MKTVTAGRDYLGEFAPKFAELNDDILFGEVWSREKELSARDRSLITVTALLAKGLCDSSFEYHLKAAKENGITRSEIAEIITHAAFYADWPKAWAAFRLAKNVWTEAEGESEKRQRGFRGGNDQLQGRSAVHDKLPHGFNNRLRRSVQGCSVRYNPH